MKQDPCEIQAKWFIRESYLCGTSIMISCKVTPACFLCNLYKREQILMTSCLLLLSAQPFQNLSNVNRYNIFKYKSISGIFCGHVQNIDSKTVMQDRYVSIYLTTRNMYSPHSIMMI